MSEPAFAPSSKAPSKAEKGAQPAAPLRGDRAAHPIGDTCLQARIVGVQIEGKRTRLLMAMPRGADVRVGGHGHVEGVFDSTFEITAITEDKFFAVAYTSNRVDTNELAGHSKALIECQTPHKPATQPVRARIIKREELGGRNRITISAGYAQGVFEGMQGRIEMKNGASFKVTEVLGERACVAEIQETADVLMANRNVVIEP
jgi:hypothetical protein